MQKFNIDFTPEFLEDYSKLTKKNFLLKKKFAKAIKLLATNPKHNSLKSHKVDTKVHSNAWSSWVTGDIRIIWVYDGNKKLALALLETGTHSGANKVYKQKSS